MHRVLRGISPQRLDEMTDTYLGALAIFLALLTYVLLILGVVTLVILTQRLIEAVL